MGEILALAGALSIQHSAFSQTVISSVIGSGNAVLLAGIPTHYVLVIPSADFGARNLLFRALERKQIPPLRQAQGRNDNSDCDAHPITRSPDHPISSYSPAIVMPSMRSVGQAVELRNSRSLPISVMLLSMSFRFPATVTSSTGKASSPFSIHKPLAPREKSPVTRFTPKPRNSVT